jgi:dihydroxy-acid dehydratase
MIGWCWSGTTATPSPNGATRSPLAYIQDGALIEINVTERRIQLLVADEEVRQWQAAPAARPDHPASGMLVAYRRMVGSADSGAVQLWEREGV